MSSPISISPRLCMADSLCASPASTCSEFSSPRTPTSPGFTLATKKCSPSLVLGHLLEKTKRENVTEKDSMDSWCAPIFGSRLSQAASTDLPTVKSSRRRRRGSSKSLSDDNTSPLSLEMSLESPDNSLSSIPESENLPLSSQSPPSPSHKRSRRRNRGRSVRSEPSTPSDLLISLGVSVPSTDKDDPLHRRERGGSLASSSPCPVPSPRPISRSVSGGTLASAQAAMDAIAALLPSSSSVSSPRSRSSSGSFTPLSPWSPEISSPMSSPSEASLEMSNDDEMNPEYFKDSQNPHYFAPSDDYLSGLAIRVPTPEPLPEWADPNRPGVTEGVEKVKEYIQDNDIPETMPLSDNWTMYFSDSSKAKPNSPRQSNNPSYSKAATARPLFSASTLPDFAGNWRTTSERLRPCTMKANQNLFWFRDGISPVWEDDRNRLGGRFTLCPARAHLNQVWDTVVMLITGDTLLPTGTRSMKYIDVEENESEESKSDETETAEPKKLTKKFADVLCGAVFARRARGDRIEIWLGEAADVEIVSHIRSVLSSALGSELGPELTKTAKFKHHFEK